MARNVLILCLMGLTAGLAFFGGLCIDSLRARVHLDTLSVASSHISPPASGDWRRSSAGWERASNWPNHRSSAAPSPLPHPAVIAALMLLAAIGALIALSPNGRPRKHRTMDCDPACRRTK